MDIEIDRTETIVRTLVFTAFAWGVIWSGIAVFLRDRLSGGRAWGAWAILVAVVAAALTRYASSSFVIAETSAATWFYMSVALIGVPSAAALLAARRENRRGERRPLAIRLGVAILSFVLALPVGAFLAALPDFITFMAQGSSSD